MRFILFFVLIILSSCSASKNISQADDLVLLEAYSKLSIGGKEADDNMNAIKHYSFVFEQNEDVHFEKVWIHAQGYEFESFEYEGKLFLVVKTFPKNDSNKIFEQIPYSSDVAGLIQYEIEKGKPLFLEVKEIEEKEATIGN